VDFKPTRYKKGDLVRIKNWRDQSLGIVIEQDAAKVRVHWIICPHRAYALEGMISLHTIEPVEKV
jgi:hypothetical protein